MVSSSLNNLNEIQKKAVICTDGPILILAGAGSGKTKVLTHKAAYLIQDKHVPAHQILMCTFTNKAAQEMKNRIKNILLVDPNTKNHELPFAGTFHGLCVKILKKDGIHIGIPPTFVIYDEQDQMDAIKEIMKRLDISIKNYHPNAIHHTISEAKNELISPLEYQQIARGAFQETIATVYYEYQNLLRDNYALDYDDLLSKTVYLFQQNTEVLHSYQEQYHYIFIDEYQDTNKAQYLLSKYLSNRYKNICVVGDASQSIYKWRGADYRNITNFKHDYQDTKEFHLEQNYRSTQMILDAAYSVISKNTSHPILKLWTDKNNGENITLYEARNEQDEATFITQTVLQSNEPFTNFVVLYRTNAQSRVLEEVFLHNGIPYILIGGTRFYERKEIKDVLSYIRLAVNPKDSVSRNRIQKLGKGRYEKFENYIHTLRSDTHLIELSTVELIDQLLEKTGYISIYDANNEEENYRLENIKELRSVALEFPNVSEFLENVALIEREYEPDTIKAKEKNRNAITLMTMHAAKGLEFSTVFVVGMEEGLFPHSRTLLDKEELEEERRLCYVAITRAKERVYLSYANNRMFFGTRTKNSPSRFISDIPENIITYQTSLGYDRGFQMEDLLL